MFAESCCYAKDVGEYHLKKFKKLKNKAKIKTLKQEGNFYKAM